PVVSDSGLSLEPPAAGVGVSLAPAIVAACDARVAVMRAQETFLRLNQKLTDSLADVVRMQTAILDAWVRGGRAGGVSPPSEAEANKRRVGSLGGLTPPARPEQA